MILPHFPLMLRSFEYHRSGPLSNIVPVVIAIRICCPAGVAVVVVVIRGLLSGVAVAGVGSVAVEIAAVIVAVEIDAVVVFVPVALEVEVEVGRLSGSGEWKDKHQL